jgi:hypothetical protein
MSLRRKERKKLLQTYFAGPCLNDDFHVQLVATTSCLQLFPNQWRPHLIIPPDPFNTTMMNEIHSSAPEQKREEERASSY